MIIYLMTRSAGSFGGNTTFSLVGDYLASGLRDYGTAIRQFDITTCFRGGRIRHSSLQQSFDEFHSKFLPSLPAVKFLRKKHRIDIQYETVVTDATFLERYGFLSVEVFRAVLNEIGEKIHLIDARLKKADDFDLAGLHEDVSRLVREAPSSDDELKALKWQMEQQRKARLAAMDPWERLDIDWDEFHPASRTLLNDPFFWSQTDAYSPHGNDTGADLLSDFRRWNRRHPNSPAHEMATSLLRAWQISPINQDALTESEVKPLIINDPIALSVTDDALIAAAFAAIKLRGCCDKPTRELAIAAIERERTSIVLNSRDWKEPSERLRTLGVLRDALSCAPEKSD